MHIKNFYFFENEADILENIRLFTIYTILLFIYPDFMYIICNCLSSFGKAFPD